METAPACMHIYKDTGKLVLRKPDDRAPAYTSAMILENWYSVSRMTVLRLTHLACNGKHEQR